MSFKEFVRPWVKTCEAPSNALTTTAKRWGVFAIMVGYVWLFFGSALPALTSVNGRLHDRWDQHLQIVASPATWIGSWCGGDVRRIQVVDRAEIVFYAAAILWVALELGQCILRRFHCTQELNRHEKTLFAAGLGLQALSMWTLGFGLAGLLHERWLFLGTMSSFVLANRWPNVSRWWRGQLANSERQAPALKPTPSPATEWLSTRWLWLAAPALIWIALAACLPPWHFDARVYHLQVPKEWLGTGRIEFLAHNVYANMPLGAEMHALLAMVLLRTSPQDWWSGVLVGKLVMATFAPLGAWALFSLGSRCFSRTAGIVAAVVYLSTPWVSFVSTTGLNEGASAFYWLLALYGIVLWSRSNDRRLLPLAGIMIGSAVSCKYPAVLFVALPLTLFVGIVSLMPKSTENPSRNNLSSSKFSLCSLNVRQAVANLLLLTIALAGSCGLWLGKNWVLTGNPTYPLLYDLFGGESRTPEKDAQWKRAHSPPANADGERFSFAQATDAVERVLWRSNGLSPLLIPLLFPLVLGLVGGTFPRGQRSLILWLAAYVGFVVLAWWFATHRFDRFLVPLLPVVALLSGVGMASLRDATLRRIAVGTLVLGVGSCFLISSSRVLGDNRVLVGLDDLRADVPQAADGYFSRISPVHRLLNVITPKPTGVLLVGDSRPFDLEVPTLYSTCFDDCWLESLLKGRTAAERRELLRKHHVSHVYVAWSEINCLRQQGEYGFTPWITPQRIHDELVRDQRLLRKLEIGLPANVGELFVVTDDAIE